MILYIHIYQKYNIDINSIRNNQILMMSQLIFINIQSF